MAPAGQSGRGADRLSRGRGGQAPATALGLSDVVLEQGLRRGEAGQGTARRRGGRGRRGAVSPTARCRRAPRYRPGYPIRAARPMPRPRGCLVRRWLRCCCAGRAGARVMSHYSSRLNLSTAVTGQYASPGLLGLWTKARWRLRWHGPRSTVVAEGLRGSWRFVAATARPGRGPQAPDRSEGLGPSGCSQQRAGLRGARGAALGARLGGRVGSD